MKRLSALLLVLLTALGVGFAASAQQYKWVDQNGRTQYGDNPPPGVKATPLRAPAAASSAPATSQSGGKPATAAEQDAAFRKRQEDSAKAADKATQTAGDASQKKEQCARSQEYLRGLESGQRIAVTDKNGERAYLDDDQRASETLKARQMVQQACN
ncbi:MAG TPA: DUF4124 domain-containing protein [Burkholderiales bacterium]|jgi:hypothetical protein